MLNKLFILVFTFSFFNFAQPSDEITRIFQQAISDYKEARWTSSLSNFNKIANEFEIKL